MSTGGSKPTSARSRKTPTKSGSKKNSKHESQHSIVNGEIGMFTSEVCFVALF